MAAGHGLGKLAGGLFYGVWTATFSNYNVSLGLYYGEEPVIVNGGSISGLFLCGAN